MRVCECVTVLLSLRMEKEGEGVYYFHTAPAACGTRAWAEVRLGPHSSGSRGALGFFHGVKGNTEGLESTLSLQPEFSLF